MVTATSKLLLLAMSGSVVLTQLGSVLMSIAHVTTGAYVNYVLNRVLKYKGHAELLPLLTAPHGRAGPLHLGKLALPLT